MLDSQPEAAKALLELAAARDDVDAHVGLARIALRSDPAAAATAALAALRVSPHHGVARQILTEARTAELGTPGPDIAELAAFLQKLVGQRRELGHLVGDVSRAAANLDQPLLVTVMGEFSSGKSSFVNAFIGADVAPTGITPTTATINVVRYGRDRGGRVVSADGATVELGWDALMAHLRALTPGTHTGHQMPAVSGPADWFAMTTRLRVVMEDPRQLLSGAVTDYASTQLVLNANQPEAVVVPGLDGEPYPAPAPRTSALRSTQELTSEGAQQ